MSERDLDKAHAELHFGKYSAGYNRGLARGRAENEVSYRERCEWREFLTALLTLDQTAEILPSEYRDWLEDLWEGRTPPRKVIT